MLIEELVPRVRKALGVSSSYDNEEIPTLIKSAVKRLLRDYNFPKSRARQTYNLATVGEQAFNLPAGYKRDFALMFYDPDPLKNEWSDPLQKAEGFRLPSADGITSKYWIEGQQFYIDVPIAADGIGKQLVLFYQSQSLALNSSWMLDDFEDAVAYLAITRGAADMRKTEVLQAYAPLWTDEVTSLAIYLNELEWDGVVVQQREPRLRHTERYPA